MTEYAKTHFEIYVKETDLKQQILIENLVPDNLDQVKILDGFSCDILKDSANKNIWTWDSTFERIQSKNACVGPSFKVVHVSRRGT